MVLIKGLTPIFILLYSHSSCISSSHGGTRLVDFGIIKIDSAGILEGIFISLRLITIVMVATIMTLSTSPIDLTDAFEKLLTPLKWFKLPVHQLSMIMSIALRFIQL